MKTSHFDQFHINPDNWKLGFIYFCKDDPRIIVPKRIRGFGWTLNFGRPLAIPLVLLVLGIAAAPVASFCEHKYDTLIFFVKLLVILGIVWLSNRISRSKA